MTDWIALLTNFLGAAFLVNGIPHFVMAMTGQKFPSPFANPPGRGDSPPLANIVWGWINFALAAVLLIYVRPLDIHDGAHMAAAVAGAVLMSIAVARYFGKSRSG